MEEAAQIVAKIESIIMKKQNNIESSIKLLYEDIRKMSSTIENEIEIRNTKIETEISDILKTINTLSMKKIELEESMDFFKENLNEILSGNETKK